MHKIPYKHRFIAGSSECWAKLLSILLTKLLTHITYCLQKYYKKSYSRSGVKQMWILKNSKELLEHLQSPNFKHITSIKSFGFSTLYTAKEKYRGMFEIQKSGDKTSSGEIGLDIRTHASPKTGTGPGVRRRSVLCWHAAPVAYVLWKPCTIR